MKASALRRLLARVPDDVHVFFCDGDAAYQVESAYKSGCGWMMELELLAYRDFDGVHEVKDIE